MYSRSHLLIERDINRLNTEKPWGIELFPLSKDSVFEWMVKMCGLKGTLWETGVFRLYLKFTDMYNSEPPDVCFHTIPFHPNVDMITGRPCVDFLDSPDLWQENYSLSFLLISLQTLLSNPVLENAINLDAASMFTNSPTSYQQIILDCVTASQRVEAGMEPYARKDRVSFAPSQEEQNKEDKGRLKMHKPRGPLSKISFEDYHNTWSGIATSKWDTNSPNPLLEAIKDKPSLQAAHFGLPAYAIQQQITKQMNDHSTLMYGKFKSRPTDEELQLAKQDQLNKMKKIYLQPRTPKTPTAIAGDAVDAISRSNTFLGNTNITGDFEEKEIDDLVTWTKGLDADQL